MGYGYEFERKLGDKVKEAIGNSFGELMTDESWKVLVAEKIREFMRDDFPALFKKTVETFVVDRIREHMRSDAVKQELEKSITERAPSFIAQMLAAVAAQMIDRASSGSYRT